MKDTSSGRTSYRGWEIYKDESRAKKSRVCTWSYFATVVALPRFIVGMMEAISKSRCTFLSAGASGEVLTE